MSNQSPSSSVIVYTTIPADHSQQSRWLVDFAITLLIFAMPFLSGCQEKQPTADALSESPDSVAEEVNTKNPPAISSHDRMVDVMAQIAQSSKTNHPILGDGNAKQLRASLQELLASGKSDPDALNTFLSLHMELGQAELKLGNLDQGIKYFSTALTTLNQLVATRGMEPGLLRQQFLEVKYGLAVAYMRKGETQNCCLQNSPDSCLLPIRGTGIHKNPEGSKKAIQYFTEVLRQALPDSPFFIKAKWLLNIMYMTIEGYPEQVPEQFLIEPSVFESEEPFQRFTNVANQYKIDTFSLLGGAIVDDFTGDGYLDIVVSTFDLQEQAKFFRNNRDGSFVDDTKAANLTGLVGGFNLVHADYDNDGDSDILMLRGAWLGELGQIPNSLLRNDGNGRFTDVTVEAGMAQAHYPTQTAAWADFDNDGDLDVYIGNEHLANTNSAPCQLFRNNGDGTFTDIASAAGVTNGRYAKGVTWGDFDDDGFPDLYVSNFNSDNRLYRNKGDGTFVDVAAELGITGPLKSFPVWFWDFNNDGNLDLFVSSYEWDLGNLAAVASSQLGLPTEFEHARLYRGTGEGGFDEVAKSQNLTRISLPMGANFGDLDNDGFLDFYLGTGYPDYEGLMPNVMYRNRRGTGFSDVTTAGGFGHLQKGHAVVFVDIDNDGDQDIFEQLGGFFPGDKYYDALFQNPGFGNNWITIKLVGVQSNRSAIGARIRIQITENGESRSVYKHVNTGGSFGANPFRQTIGLGSATSIETLEIFWPTSQQKQIFRNVPVNQVIEITEAAEEYQTIQLEKFGVDPPHGTEESR